MNCTPALRVDAGRVSLSGTWTLAGLQPILPQIQSTLAAAPQDGIWDFSAVDRLDSAAAVLLWRHWAMTRPTVLGLTPAQQSVLDRVAALSLDAPAAPTKPAGITLTLGHLVLRGLANLRGVVTLFGHLLLDLLHLARHPLEFPWREFSANVYKAGAMALPVTALVGFLIGITISYLSALQLKNFGADLFIVNILGISILRELGPVLVAVLVAGRSGSAMTAQIGVMRVTEEIDALATMGISRHLRLVLPKILALTVAMPLLVLWTSCIALFGGMVAALLQLDLSLVYFLENLPRAVPVANLMIGLGKGVVFGFVIALIACHFGLRVIPNTESLSANTTRAVVSAITLVILVDAVFAVLTRHIGLPQL